MPSIRFPEFGQAVEEILRERGIISAEPRKIAWRPLPRQQAALDSPAFETLYGGAAGGGKSHLLRAAAICWCAAVPGLQEDGGGGVAPVPANSDLPPRHRWAVVHDVERLGEAHGDLGALGDCAELSPEEPSQQIRTIL